MAATAVKGVSLKQVKKILDAYAVALATCHACDNTGELRDKTNDVIEESCPVCGTKLVKEGVSRKNRTATYYPKGDARYVEWRCSAGASIDRCQMVLKGLEDSGKEDHTPCGPVALVPVDRDAFTAGLGGME